MSDWQDPFTPMATYEEAHPEGGRAVPNEPAVQSEPPSVAGASNGEVDLLAKLRNGSWLDAQTFPPLEYHIPGLIPEGLVLLVGTPKIGKSWLVLAFGLAVAAGGHALGQIPVTPRPVLYLALEDGDRRLQDRCRTLLGEGVPIPAAFEYLTHVQPGMVLATIAEWMGRRAGEAPLLILDTLAKVMPPALQGESAYQRDYRVGSGLKWIVDSEAGSSGIVNHHDRKANADDFVDSVSGTHGLAGTADTIAVVARRRHETAGLLSITGRDVVEGEYALQFETGSSWRLDGSGLDAAAAMAAQRRATAGLGDRSIDIVAYVAKHPTGVTAAQGRRRSSTSTTPAATWPASSTPAPLSGCDGASMGHPPPPRTVSQPSHCPIWAPCLGQRDTWDTVCRGPTVPTRKETR